MTAVVQPQPTARTARARLNTSTQLPIADLSPSQLGFDAHILAQVALVWPYSSSTGTLSLLLADPDIRRRKSKGQVKAVFRNGCAKQVAKSKVGIGDTVRLALAGCEWKETGDVVSTPGKKINWDLEYNTCVLLEILRGDEETATVDFTGKETNGSIPNGLPAYLNKEDVDQPEVTGATHQSSTILVPYLTPRKSVGNHVGGTFIDAALESLVEDDGHVPGRGRKRTKFARSSGAWSLVDLEADSDLQEVRKADVDGEDASQGQTSQAEGVVLAPDPASVDTLDERNQPVHQTGTEISKEVVLQSSLNQSTEEDVVEVSIPVPPPESIPPPILTQPQVMGPPQTPVRAPPRLQPTINSIDDFDTSDGSEPATTPRLLPIPSPGLPLVSPLVHRSGVEIGYFPPLDISISQLDASTERRTEAAISKTDTADLTDRSLMHSEESPVFVGGISTSEEAAVGFESTGDVHGDTVLVSRESQVAFVDQESAEKTAYEAPQWLSSLESSIDRELLLSQDQPTAHNISQHTSQAVEVEDDDLYGAPVDVPNADPSFATSPSVERPRSPLDVLEQFLQISPTTAAGFSIPTESDGWKNAPNIPLQHDVPEDMAVGTPQERTTVSTSSNRSPGTYPEPQSPFRQNRQHQASTVSSTRSSLSQTSRSQSFDGQTDERETFREYINHLAQLSANSEPSKQLVPGVEPSHNDIQSETQVKTDVSLTTVKVDANAQVEVPEDVLEEVNQATGQSAATDEVKDELQHLPIATSDEVGSGLTQMEHVHPPEAHAQLPTPDQSQVQRPSTEPETSKPVQELTEVGILSPRYTQEEIDRNSQEPALPVSQEMTQVTYEDSETVEVVRGKARLSGQAERADTGTKSQSLRIRKESPANEGPPASPSRVSTSPTTARPISALQSDTVTPRRSSRRLSAKQSAMSANLSSPYFPPHKSIGRLSSSPPRKENLNPGGDDSTLRPLPTRKQAEEPLLSTALQEADQAHINITSVSPDSRANGSVFSENSSTTTPLAYFPRLRSLHEQFGQLVDVIAVCTNASLDPEQSKTGRKDYHTTLQLTDPSIASETRSAVSAQVFRPVRKALPSTHRGDVVILRNFKVQTFRRQFTLLSTDTSSWAVFEARAGTTMTWSGVVISGPPLEYGDTETERVKLLFSWWSKSGKEIFNVEPTPQAELPEVENGSPKLLRSSPRLKETPQPSRTVAPSSRRLKAGTNDNFGNGGENLETLTSPTAGPAASKNNETAKSRDRDEASPQLVNTTEGVHHDSETTVYVQASKRRQANETDNFGNEGDEDVAMGGDDWEQSVPFADKSNRRRGSTISTAPSESGTSFTPRRSARLKKSPSLVHELRDGTRYVDDGRRRSGSVVHELRDGVTYVDD
ncbi:uncharacterized protein Z520_05984 [Fonsecaea multimorphosa CBS 102226]|uniref:Telomeric single stranded DNA binding POT1/Cdc13 domain-containing protein n=1 Tax=Fonsecaea multimorphosa CBS 102226 TaxID=1442371 RepID=A0A0D2KPM9_9EURO|nr:uncharacterized protein Z520_05984 [Fonsecaea multimorphosa CBS 102226]KIX98683.1 hypothetical protein Z520_05984 [Fonsecaea multimorphosa CBS 102226]OAL24868.1 hypothetical protein AYO22_05657 [Fonsecaea multimorphosa]